MAWTEERRQRQREIINRCKPWEKSTGPKSLRGKESSSLNALKHGGRSRAMRHLSKLLRVNQEFRKYCELYYSEDALVIRKTNELIKNRLKSNIDAQKTQEQ